MKYYYYFFYHNNVNILLSFNICYKLQLQMHFTFLLDQCTNPPP